MTMFRSLCLFMLDTIRELRNSGRSVEEILDYVERELEKFVNNK